MHTANSPITVNGTYDHTDGTVGEYAWVNGHPKLLRTGADLADLDRQREAEAASLEAHRAEQQRVADAEMRDALHYRRDHATSFSTANWEGTAEQIEELRAFARNFNWEDWDVMDSEHAATEVIDVLERGGEDGEMHPDAHARLRAALIDSAERENNAREGRVS